ncbi:MAG TPA: LemA domain-containing protein [Myxococcales bacterium]|nr:LemA domain-containing protein [Myxococcales bacterium]HBU46957.1 LemA domain-containing protein [Myxococcales bacterium]|tara:strand:- start:11 stop:1318 length:1308 start_codon:yes stop_codon:yes gene_type:complete
MSQWLWFIIPSLFILIFHKFASRAFRLRRLMAALPTSKVQGVFIGLVEVKGQAKGVTHTTFLEETEALCSQWTVEEEWQKTEVDSDGKTRSSSGWKTVASGSTIPAFFVEDETGALRVHPEGAELTQNLTFSYRCRRRDAFYYAKGPAKGIANSTGNRRFRENTIQVGDALYIMGQARLREDVVAPEIAADPDTGNRYIITVKSEEQLARGAFWQGLILGLLAVGLFPLMTLIDAAPSYFHSLWFPWLTAFINLLILFALWSWRIYDDLVQVRNRVDQGRKNIDVQLKRRFDLIPNLVDVAKQVASAETSLHETLAQLRRGTTLEGPQKSVGKQLLAVSENYPTLQQSEAFLTLQNTLVDTEDRIALSRDYFNEIATHANTLSEVIPDKFFVGLAGIGHTELFEAENFERKALVVNFDDLEAPVSNDEGTPLVES